MQTVAGKRPRADTIHVDFKLAGVHLALNGKGCWHQKSGLVMMRDKCWRGRRRGRIQITAEIRSSNRPLPNRSSRHSREATTERELWLFCVSLFLTRQFYLFSFPYLPPPPSPLGIRYLIEGLGDVSGTALWQKPSLFVLQKFLEALFESMAEAKSKTFLPIDLIFLQEEKKEEVRENEPCLWYDEKSTFFGGVLCIWAVLKIVIYHENNFFYLRETTHWDKPSIVRCVRCIILLTIELFEELVTSICSYRSRKTKSSFRDSTKCSDERIGGRRGAFWHAAESNQ